jgi:hypothetical protein
MTIILDGTTGISSIGTLTGVSGITFTDTTAQSTAASPGIGIGQTWQSVVRSAGVTYTNSTGKPILFMMSYASGAGSNDYVTLTVGGVSFFWIGAVLVSGVVFGQNTAIIPPGFTYSFSSTGGVSKTIFELR